VAADPAARGVCPRQPSSALPVRPPSDFSMLFLRPTGPVFSSRAIGSPHGAGARKTISITSFRPSLSAQVPFSPAARHASPAFTMADLAVHDGPNSSRSTMTDLAVHDARSSRSQWSEIRHTRMERPSTCAFSGWPRHAVPREVISFLCAARRTSMISRWRVGEVSSGATLNRIRLR